MKVSSSAVTNTTKRYDETGSHEDGQRKGIPRVTSIAEDKFIRVICTSDIAGQINTSQSSSNRPISASAVQRRLCESGLQGRIAAKITLLKNTTKGHQ